MATSYALWQIDDATLSYYYKAEETSFGVYYNLSQPAEGFSEGFYASERDQEMADYNQQLQMAQTSGDIARRERGKMVDDDTTLPSARIEAGARQAGGQVISSGEMARESRKKKKN